MLWIVSAALSFTGCSEYAGKNGGAPSSPDSQPSDGASDSGLDTGAISTAPIPEATFYGVRLGFETLAGGIVEGTASVEIDLWSDASPPAVVCRHEAAVLGAAAEDIPVLDTLEVDAETGAGGLVGWWRLELDAGVPDAPCPAWAARTLWVGLGPYDPRLNPALDAVGMLGTELFGLYLQEDADGPVYVVGVGGTTEMFVGGYGPDPEAPPPLPDGLYTAESLLLMSL